ncbi:MAG: hypothetical protein ABGZ53_02715 [Fuerstiella sp.]
MPRQIPLPDALKHLLEKRMTAARREEIRRDAESAAIAAALAEEHRSGQERREVIRRLEK